MKIVEFANNIDPYEVAQNELPHLDLHFADINFVVCCFCGCRINVYAVDILRSAFACVMSDQGKTAVFLISRL